MGILLANDQIVRGNFQVALQKLDIGAGSELGMDGLAGAIVHIIGHGVEADLLQRHGGCGVGRAIVDTDLRGSGVVNAVF